MRSTDTLVIGAGQAGLALSWFLTAAGHDHVVLERGRIAERWRSERWDSLRTLTPNWMSRLPGHEYTGPDPDGFMTAHELADYLGGYARSFGAPVEDGTSVESVTQTDTGFEVTTDRGTWRSGNVVVATGWCDQPRVPSAAAALPADIAQIPSSRYRNPSGVPDGAVLVVGASASGAQIADELVRAGRDVILAVGNHTRMPRQHRGVDICRWLEVLGVFDRSLPHPSHPRASEPSLQLTGRTDGRRLDLGTLRADGVRLVGRLRAADATTLTFADDLEDTIARSNRSVETLLGQIDDYVASHGLTGIRAAEPLPPVPAERGVPSIDLRAEGVSTVVWATGFRRTYPWLRLPAFDASGEIAHRGGVTAIPGLYVMGMRFQSRRRSTFVDGVRFDAAHVASHLTASPALVTTAA